MSVFAIEIENPVPKKIYGITSVTGQIQIGDFKETFVMPIDDWGIGKYQQQWQQGIDRIKKYDVSCLVTSVENIKSKSPSVEMWALYKEKGTIFFQHLLLTDETLSKGQPKLSKFRNKNCYEYVVMPRETVTEDGSKISEWKLDSKLF